LLLLAAVILLSAACRQSRSPDQPAELRIELVAPLFAPAVGPDALRVQLLDRAGEPVDNAQLRARADMTHAGMAPIFAEAQSTADGLYRLPLEWTMNGDWIVTVDAELPDGRSASRQFNVTVTGDRIHCNENE
jgi:nitrogen fixation protein FixH